MNRMPTNADSTRKELSSMLYRHSPRFVAIQSAKDIVAKDGSSLHAFTSTGGDTRFVGGACTQELSASSESGRSTPDGTSVGTGPVSVRLAEPARMRQSKGPDGTTGFATIHAVHRMARLGLSVKFNESS